MLKPAEIFALDRNHSPFRAKGGLADWVQPATANGLLLYAYIGPMHVATAPDRLPGRATTKPTDFWRPIRLRC